MVIPGAGRTTSNTDTEDIFINEDLFISSCDRFKYLGSIYTPSMKNALDIENCISKAQQLFSSLNKLVFRNVDIDVQIRKRIYIAIITNILLWGCESWALTSEERRKMEVFHTRCCRRMLNITIYDVMANHELTNKYILHELNMLKLESYMELRRARWLEKISHMEAMKMPRKLLGAWINQARRNGKFGRSQNTIRHAFADSLRTLSFSGNFQFADWMEEAKDREKWSKRVENFLHLPDGSYCRRNAKHRAAELRNYNLE